MSTPCMLSLQNPQANSTFLESPTRHPGTKHKCGKTANDNCALRELQLQVLQPNHLENFLRSFLQSVFSSWGCFRPAHTLVQMGLCCIYWYAYFVKCVPSDRFPKISSYVFFLHLDNVIMRTWPQRMCLMNNVLLLV